MKFDIIKVRDIVDKHYGDYYKPSMFIVFGNCDWQCTNEGGFECKLCQDISLTLQQEINIRAEILCERYVEDTTTNAILIGGLEPMTNFSDLYSFIHTLRVDFDCHDDVVIYTGYYPHEIEKQLEKLSEFDNIIFKFGRYIPYGEPKFDEVLKVELSSDNQFGCRVEDLEV